MKSLFAMGAGAFVTLTASLGWTAEETYKVDGVHSSVLFKVKHMGAANFYGRFNDISGTLIIDPANSAKNSLEVQIKTESVDTGNAKRDQHLKSPDFFSAKEFPAISLKGKSVKKTGDHAFEVTGDLTLHGITKEIAVKLERTGTGKDPLGGGDKTGFETTFTIKRSDFGMKFALDGVSDEVQLIISVECSAK